MEYGSVSDFSDVSEPTPISSQNSLTGDIAASSSQNSLPGSMVTGSSHNPMTGGCGSGSAMRKRDIILVSRKRKRRRCLKCYQELSHSAYNRHQSSSVCSGPNSLSRASNAASLVTENSGSIGVVAEDWRGGSEVVEDYNSVTNSYLSDSGSSSEGETSNGYSSEISSGSEPGIISSDEEIEDYEFVDKDQSIVEKEQLSTDTQEGMPQTQSVNKIVFHIGLFITFFQLCYQVSERGITLLLNFLKCLLLWLYSLNPNTSSLKMIAEKMPSNVYFLKKLVGKERESEITLLVSCPKCHSVYQYKDCIVNRGGQTISLRCSYVEYPNHPHVRRRAQCGTVLMKSINKGSKSNLIPRKLYPYISIKNSLSRLCSRTDFLQKCEHWRGRTSSEEILTDIYDGAVWKAFQVVNDRPFLQLPNNLCLKLNLDWFNPFKHVQYSVGVLYLVVENLPRSERYKLENIIVVGTLPGPKEPKYINSYLKPLIDELLILWNGVILRNSSMFGITPIRCALTCITCDLPATRKLCGFKSFSSLHGCSKCFKEFPCESFGVKPDYSGFQRDHWVPRTHNEHLRQVNEVMAANTATKRDEIEKKYGVRYSELLRLPYIDVVNFHVIDPMHNLLLGTAKHVTSLWKDLGYLNNENLVAIQEKIDLMKIPAKLGRIPYKISSNFSSLTADQWKNWIFAYSQYALHGILPIEHYTCWCLFVDACRYLLQPSISLHHLNEADKKLVEFNTSFELVFGKEHTTPNMHLHLHIKDCVFNYGPVHSFWCFPFERFNGVLGSFQKNWISPELQMLKKFVSYQNVLLTDTLTLVPQEFRECFHFQLSSNQDHVNS